MLYELRIYYTVPGRMPALQKRFREDTVRIFERLGIRAVGYFTDHIGPDCDNKLTYLLAWEDLEERDRRMDALLADPEWIAARARSEADGGPIVERVENSILLPTSFSPLQ